MNQLIVGYGNTNVTQEFNNRTLAGFSFVLRIDEGAAAPLKSDVYLQNANIRASLMKNGKQYGDIVSGQLGHILKHCAIGKNSARYVNYNEALIAVAVGYYEIRGTILFPCPVELTGQDKIELTASFPTSAWNQANIANIATAGTYMKFEEIVTIGRQVGIPRIKSIPIPSNQTTYTTPLGNNLYRLSLSTANDLLLNDAHILSTLTLNSDKENKTLNKVTLENENSRGTLDAFVTGAKMVTAPPCALNNASIQYDGAVSTDGNYIAYVAEYLEPDSAIFANSVRQQQKHQAENVNNLIA